VMWAPRATITMVTPPSTRSPHTVPGMEQNPILAPAPTTASPSVAMTRSTTASSTIDWWRVAAVTYLLGVFVMLGRVALGVCHARRLLARAVRDGDYLVHSRCVVPLTVGVLNPQVVLPADWSTWERRELAAVLAHEEAHARRRDPLVALVMLIN